MVECGNRIFGGCFGFLFAWERGFGSSRDVGCALDLVPGGETTP